MRISSLAGGPSFGRHIDLQSAGKIFARQGPVVFQHPGRRPLKDHMATVDAGTGPHVDDMVCGQDRVFVMLNHQHRIAHVPHVHQRAQQTLVVALMQTDTGLVQYIEHAGQFGADLGGQADSLALSTGQGVGRPVQGQIG